ncbi:glucose-1-phosphate adenylyltransferase subunit GlgD [Vallitalea maricola]|uniref:Glucose-1-phosphate adenylyltransferase subunit GlgD n=1 Tax=Vallitalea maricola TaxID=3074433 RepID=A0ACB5UHJ4_9FIRM|nr:glucose-1-phosphate adenylyltransferase subunit GlgD [Vallitalea sp. AN17-2]
MRAIGVILTGGKNEKLHELTDNRILAAMPIAGCYRAIDFSLSNMTNSGIKKVAVITQYNSRPLIEHLSSSKWWDFGRKQGGLFIFSPNRSQKSNFWYRGTADAIYQNLDYLKDSHEPYAIISSGNVICKVDYNKILEYHVDKRADITIVCKDMKNTNEDLRRFGMVLKNDENRIIDFEEKPLEPQGTIISTGIYVVRRRLLIELIEEILSGERYDIVNDIIIRYRKQKKIYAYMHNEYFNSIANVESYYNCNMDFLDKNNRKYFFGNFPYISSKVQDEPPAKYNSGSVISNSLISGGCIINGKVNNSILFRKVFIGKNTSINNSIILDGAYIGNNCCIENSIVNTDTVIGDDCTYKDRKGNIKIVVNRECIYM